MRVLVSGHNGYIGSVLVPMLADAGHDVTGLDTYFYEELHLRRRRPPTPPSIRRDIRDLDRPTWRASTRSSISPRSPTIRSAISAADITYEINHRASVHLAQLAKDAGVYRASCSRPRAASTVRRPAATMLDEQAAFNPVTPVR